LLTFLVRDALSFLSRFREPDRYGLLSAFNFAAFPTPAAFRSAPLIAPHLAFDVAARAGGIFALPFLCHWVSRYIDEVHLSPNRFFHKKSRMFADLLALAFNKYGRQIEWLVVWKVDRYDSQPESAQPPEGMLSPRLGEDEFNRRFLD
jgi:hypothetical protein